MAKMFPARYSGTCEDGSECDGEFDSGDMIGYNEDDELCCRACLMAQRAETAEAAEGWKDFPL